MTKRGKSHAQEPAAAEPEAFLDLTATGGAPSEPETDLAGENSGAPETAGQEQLAAAPAADDANQPVISRDPLTFLNVVMESGLFEEYREGAETLIEALEASPALEPASLTVIKSVGIDRAAEGYSDGAVYTANCAAFSVIDYISEYQEVSDDITAGSNLLALGDDVEPSNAIAVFVRQIGRDRATPTVVAQQLKILGYRASGDIDPVEEVVYGTFIRTLCDLDDYDRAEEARQKALMARPAEPVPVPIEDTTMEPVPDTMETF